jgi:hypothetical protein
MNFKMINSTCTICLHLHADTLLGSEQPFLKKPAEALLLKPRHLDLYRRENRKKMLTGTCTVPAMCVSVNDIDVLAWFNNLEEVLAA